MKAKDFLLPAIAFGAGVFLANRNAGAIGYFKQTVPRQKLMDIIQDNFPGAEYIISLSNAIQFDWNGKFYWLQKSYLLTEQNKVETWEVEQVIWGQAGKHIKYIEI